MNSTSLKYIALLLSIVFSKTIFSQKKLTKAEALNLSRQDYQKELNFLKPNAERAWHDHLIRFKQYETKLDWRIFNSSDDSTNSLYISLHGGGNTEPRVNDQQWYNQIDLYTIPQGIYVAPRAPTNTWNLWHEDHIDNIFDSIIRYAILMENVDPNKVYLLGYSAGGDGVYQMAPRMTDRWAAASMMAGHPGDVDFRNFRNLPFDMFVGGLDAAYDRNTLTKRNGDILDSLHALDTQGYIHKLQIYPNDGHWMQRKDTIAISWMKKFVRNSNPKRVIWVQDDRFNLHQYWLEVPSVENVTQKDWADVIIEHNIINVMNNTYPELYINLNDHLVDLDKKIIVIINGKQVYKGKLKRSENVIAETVKSYLDRDLIYSARLIIKDGKAIVYN